jgi:two-component system, OmpR family, alkaline phosphatase synthesis response regulator PhoP
MAATVKHREKAEKKKVLIVDDEYTIRELVGLTLEPDYKVIKAENGTEAMEILTETTPDLVILDIMMPRMDGYEVCRRIKGDELTKKTPIIMLTAKHMLDDVKEAIRADCDEYITKPFEPEFLKKRVDVYLGKDEKTGTGEKKLYQFGKSLHYIKDSKKA